jgi:ketosteroid isomerase-like protein
MAATDDLQTIRNGYEAFARGDVPAVLENLDPSIAWHISGSGSLSGTYKGHDEVVGFFTQLSERSGGTFGLDIHDMLASDDHVIALVKESAERDGRHISFNVVHVWHLQDGKATEFWGIAEDQDFVKEFWDA